MKPHRQSGIEGVHPGPDRTRREIADSKIDPAVDNMLKITGDGRKAALDMRSGRSGAEPSADVQG